MAFKCLISDTSVLSGFDFTAELANLTVSRIIVTILTAALCGAVVYLTYRFFYRGVVYSENFNILLVLTTVVTSFIIMTISANKNSVNTVAATVMRICSNALMPKL